MSREKRGTTTVGSEVVILDKASGRRAFLAADLGVEIDDEEVEAESGRGSTVILTGFCTKHALPAASTRDTSRSDTCKKTNKRVVSGDDEKRRIGRAMRRRRMRRGGCAGGQVNRPIIVVVLESCSHFS